MNENPLFPSFLGPILVTGYNRILASQAKAYSVSMFFFAHLSCGIGKTPVKYVKAIAELLVTT